VWTQRPQRPQKLQLQVLLQNYLDAETAETERTASALSFAPEARLRAGVSAFGLTTRHSRSKDGANVVNKKRKREPALETAVSLRWTSECRSLRSLRSLRLNVFVAVVVVVVAVSVVSVVSVSKQFFGSCS
jgi:hypothetical protein